MRTSPKMVLFTDLDGTLLDRDTYSCAAALPALELLRSMKIPIIFCSAKTRAEQEAHRQELGITDPFIVENGGAIFIPRDYFSFPFDYHRRKGDFMVIELGISYEKIRRSLCRIREEGQFHFKGFGDMSAEEVMAITGLDMEAAHRAREREYGETLEFGERADEIERALRAIRASGLNYTHGGRFYGVMGPNDKGSAVSLLLDLFHKKLGQLKSIGIGDSINDVPMLSAVDVPMLVQKAGGSWENINLDRLQKIQGIGPAGWARAVMQIAEA
ncbi:MAG: mannosyl-3-phosphoglycerate phosphatase [Dehalococcoidia bacterium]|nr:mannosyl-3-phosphoglycerate phosphatase [Dehalococcoidia bacterium]